MVETRLLRHIEGFSPRRVEWLKNKIVRDGIWKKPIALDSDHHLVLDGQHRMEVALVLGLKRIPAVKFDYALVRVWSLRPKYTFDWQHVVERALAGDIYPYKTVKHAFPAAIPTCEFNLNELRR
jgi:hypothetical protein